MRMEWILIAAIGQRGEMGLNGKLPWSHPEDLRFFKNTTADCPLIMGRKTFDSLPGLLKNRPHLILSNNDGRRNEQVTFFRAPQEIKSWCEQQHFNKAFVIGGSQIYSLLAPQCSKFLITQLEHSFTADTFFPLEILKERPILSKTPLRGESFQEYSATIIEYGSA